MARKAILNLNGFTKEMDVEYIQYLTGGRPEFKYPFPMLNTLGPMTREIPSMPNHAVARFILVGKGPTYDYYEGEVEG
jgi:hypothetical protein